MPVGEIKARQETWIENDFKNKVGRLSDLIQQLQGVKRDLSKLRVAVPNWMVQDPYQPMRRGLVPGTDTADTASHSVK